MPIKMLLTIGSVLFFMYGLSFLLFPAELMQMRDMQANESAILVSRIMASFALSFGILGWLFRGINNPEALKFVSVAFFSNSLITVAVILHYIASAFSFSPMVWADLTISLLLIIGFLPHVFPAFSKRVKPAV
jgi:predicted membrane-bound spermidine synthase